MNAPAKPEADPQPARKIVEIAAFEEEFVEG